MRWLALLALPCGCDGVLGLHETRLADATHADAPPTCAGIGMPPTFVPVLHQVTTTDCNEYVPSVTAGTATAACHSVASYGPIDADLVPLAVVGRSPNSTFDYPRLAPEGDELWIREAIPNTGYALDAYRLGSDGTFSYDHAIAVPSSLKPEQGFYNVGNTSAGPLRHFIYGDAQVLSIEPHELIADDTGAVQEAIGTVASLGGLSLNSPIMISADGLRLVFVGFPTGGGPTAPYYADRPALDAPFAMPVVLDLPGGNQLATPYLRADCDRIYFSIIGFVFYLVEV
jgi:hypothetical protein